MRVLEGGGETTAAGQRSYKSYASNPYQVDGDKVSGGHGPPKRARTNGLRQTQASQADILLALDKWMKAVQSSADFMDGEASFKAMSELEKLRDEIRNDSFKGDPAVLGAVLESQFPKVFVDLLQTLDAFEGKPLLECVAASFGIETLIATGKQAESGGLGQGRIAHLADSKELELERFEVRALRCRSEQEQREKREHLAAGRHVLNLDAAEKSLREMRAEEGRIRMELAKVHAEAAHQHALLEKMVKERGNGREDSVDSAKNGPLSEALETAWEGPTIDLFTADLLRVRVGIDGVIDRVSAAGQHLSLVYNVTEFLHEAKAAMMSQCDDILLEALQDELALLRQDRTNSSQLLVELKKFTAGKEGGELGSSLDSKYSKFYLGQLKTMNSRHVRSRFAAASLLASLKQSPSAGTSTLLDLAAQVVQAIDQVRSATKVDMLAPEEEIASTKTGTLILWPLENKSALAIECGSDDASKLRELQSNVQKRVDVRECTQMPHVDTVQLAEVACGPHARASSESPEADGSAEKISVAYLCEALNELCTGKVQSGMCWLPLLNRATETGANLNNQPDAAFTVASLLGAALMQTRADFIWLRRIAMVDFWSLAGGPLLTSHTAAMSDPDLLVVSPHATSAIADAGQDDRQETWTRQLEEMARKVAGFQPQLIVCILGDEAKTRASDKVRMRQWVVEQAAKCCKGRALAVCGSADLAVEYLKGTLEL